MKIVPLTQEALHHRVAALWGGDLDAPWVLLEAVRKEAQAHLTLTRRVLMDRVMALLTPVMAVSKDDVEDAIEQLEVVGDLTAGKGGWLAAAPLRAMVVRPGRYALAAGASTEDLAALLAPETVQGGPLRHVFAAAPDTLEARVAELGGRVLPLERWAGLERVGPADEAWLTALTARWESVADCDAIPPGDWSSYATYAPRVEELSQRRRWKPGLACEALGLIRARQPGGWWAYAFGIHHKHETRLVLLKRDEAMRTTFALDRQAQAPLTLQATRHAEVVELDLDVMLPFAEYRYLTALADRLDGDTWPARYRLDFRDWNTVSTLFTQRLGLILTDLEMSS